MRKEDQALQDFYYFEYRYRGWALFDYPVSLEVPFVPFPERNYGYEQGYDDGKSLSLIQQMRNLVAPKKQEIEEPTLEYQYPDAIESKRKLSVLVISFPLDFDSSVVLFQELITTLSFTKDSVSFEIIATGENITVQLVCSEYDLNRVRSHVVAYFPMCRITDGDQWSLPFEQSFGDIAVVDFGLKNETMLPLRIPERFDIDPLTSLFALFETLRENESAMLQIMIQGTNNPLSSHFKYAVSDGMGGSFLADVPELVLGCEIKTSSPLLSVGIRLAVQGRSQEHTAYLGREAITSITSVTKSEYNSLIPLSNKGYDYNQHMMNLFYRFSNRHGMILSVNEVVTIFHYPHKSIVSEKLRGDVQKTKVVSSSFTNQKYTLGTNIHEGIERLVSLNDKHRLEHTHVIGGTGTGKSTYLANSILNDIEAGNGCALFDPHGDIVEDVLLRVPEHRKDDVIIIDPSDTQFPVGFNLLHASNEAEKLVLSSDLVSAFRSTSTSWGDTMTSVLSNAIDTFLDSSHGGTLIELKRFLLEDGFRKQFLRSVSDPALLYYWKHEYAMVRKRISPLLTRMDTFLRPKIIRSMMVQKEGVDISRALLEKKIILFKLSLGLIGKENASLLGSLFLSKLNQSALGRQSIAKEQRHPFYVYIDECHHLMSPSICDMLSGTRKYGMGLILAHQDLEQIQDRETLSLMLSMPFTRVCFRLGETDAKRLESTLSYFDRDDLQNLGRGETLMRLGLNKQDCNVATFPLSYDMDREQRNHIIEQSQQKYGTPKADIDRLIASLYPQNKTKDIEESTSPAQEPLLSKQINHDLDPITPSETITGINQQDKEDILKRAEKTEVVREHRKIQAHVKKLGQDYGFVSVIEHEIQDNKRIDVSLERKDLKIACEISVTNTASYEVGNIQKSFVAGYDMVLVISDFEPHLQAIQTKAKKELSSTLFKKVLFIQSGDVKAVLESTKPKEKPKTEIIKGYRVKTEFVDTNENEANQFRKDIDRILRKKRK